jgi:predicted Zn-dependent protease
VEEQALLGLADNLLDRARKAGAGQAEAAVSYYRSVETNIENSRIHTVQAAEETVFGLRVLVGDSLGFVTANGTDHSTIESCV